MTTDQMLEYLRSRSIDTGDCWIWTGWTRPDGLPMASLEGRRGVVIRRWIWETQHQQPAGGWQVIASCGNVRCVNPDHVKRASGAEKARIFWSHTPTRTAVSTRLKKSAAARKNSRLTASDVAEIRLRHADGESLTELARRYSVARTTITKIVRYRSWVDLGDMWRQLRQP